MNQKKTEDLQAKVKKLEEEVKSLKEGHNEFNRAIAHALKLSPYDTYAFLHFWNAKDWDACCYYDFEYVRNNT